MISGPSAPEPIPTPSIEPVDENPDALERIRKREEQRRGVDTLRIDPAIQAPRDAGLSI